MFLLLLNDETVVNNAVEINETNTTYRLTKNQIIQDLPFNSFEEQIFNSIGMTDEEIEESRRMLK